jgi:multidrug efflux pump subunit AcrA (membrane-fusion protein)
MKTRQQLTELQSQLDQTQSLRNANRQNLLSAQQQISTKINELYEMNDKLADLLQSTI